MQTYFNMKNLVTRDFQFFLKKYNVFALDLQILENIL
jgi:hypothetical protein